MAYDFPASPSENQEYTPAGGVTYVFKSPRWTVKSHTHAEYVLKAGDTMTGDLTISKVDPSLIFNDTSLTTGRIPVLFQEAGVNKWEIGADNTKFSIFTREGVTTPFEAIAVARATGVVTMASGAVVPTPALGDNDTSVATTEFVTRAFVSLPTANPRNLIINPAMQISQEFGNTATSVANSSIADMFGDSLSGAAVLSKQRVQSVTPNGSKDRIRATVTTADASLAAGEYASWYTAIEGLHFADARWGTASAKPIVLRFGWKSPAGVFSVGFYDANYTRSYFTQFTISAGQANTDTEQTLVIPGDTSGTWLTDTGVGLAIYWFLAVGSGMYGTANAWAGAYFLGGTAGNYNGVGATSRVYELFDVGCYLDPLSTGRAPAWQPPTYAEELARCMRYWQKAHCQYQTGSVQSASSYYATGAVYPPMRTTPTFAGLNAGNFSFPATVGTYQLLQGTLIETRVANATNIGVFASTVTLNARI